MEYLIPGLVVGFIIFMVLFILLAKKEANRLNSK